MRDYPNELRDILNGSPWGLRERLIEYIEKIETTDTNERPKKRTYRQNNSLHLAFTLLANALNDAGLDLKKVLKQEVDIPWTVSSVKDYLFRPIMIAMTGKESTKDLDKLGEIDKIWDTLFRHLGEKHGLEYIPFPDNTEQRQKEYNEVKKKLDRIYEETQVAESQEPTEKV